MDTFEIGGEFEVDQLGFCAMRLTNYLMLGEPHDPRPPEPCSIVPANWST
jgi:hypothetical protein